MTGLRRLNYDMTILATPSAVSLLGSNTGWFNDGGNVRLVDYDADPKTDSQTTTGEWRDPPGCVLRESPGLIQF